MAMIFGGWSEEKTNEDIFNEIFGYPNSGISMQDNELVKEIEKKMEDNFVSNVERKKMSDLQQKINNETNLNNRD